MLGKCSIGRLDMKILILQQSNLDKVFNLPVNCRTSLMLDGFLMSMRVCHLSGLASIPLLVSMKPKNFPAWTPKEQLARFKRMLYFLTCWGVSFKSFAWIPPSLVFTPRSSI
jgi:hypothetical protein